MVADTDMARTTLLNKEHREDTCQKPWNIDDEDGDYGLDLLASDEKNIRAKASTTMGRSFAWSLTSRSSADTSTAFAAARGVCRKHGAHRRRGDKDVTGGRPVAGSNGAVMKAIFGGVEMRGNR